MPRDKTPDTLEREHNSTLAKLDRQRERQKAQLESAEEQFRKTASKVVAANRNKLSQDFLNKWTGKELPDQRFMDALRGKNDGFNSQDFEPGEVTGDPNLEDRYWEREDD